LTRSLTSMSIQGTLRHTCERSALICAEDVLEQIRGREMAHADEAGNGSSRRDLLKRAGAAAAALSTPGWLAACGGSSSKAVVHPGAGEWKRFAGTTLNFISENTAP